jgi:TolB-like protein/Tfp pilus assembly protein PilF/predicted Ser/Thr protein kinase
VPGEPDAADCKGAPRRGGQNITATLARRVTWRPHQRRGLRYDPAPVSHGVPAQIGRYRVLSRLGAGGMGEVFLAEDRTLGRQVALKILPPTTDPDRGRRFVQEARLASALNHPNVAQIFEIGEADGVTFIAMEFVEGEPLSARVQRGVLPVAEVLGIATQMFDALDEAHSRGIVHRDLKPANILITPRGRVKLLDFGLAKAIDSEVGLRTATQLHTDPGLVLGTVPYMSPEQALGHDVDARSDIFSAGVVLYELTTGRLPFCGASTTETLDRIVHAEPESISRLNYGAPAELERIIRKALEKEPARRYQNARDVLVDLNNLKRDSDSAVRQAPAAAKRSRKAIDSVAVLPLGAEAGDAEIDYLADGITETLIDALSQLPKLKVMARSTVFRYKGRDVQPQTVGRELDVRAVLLGRVQSIGGRLVVRAELVDTVDGAHIWGGRFQRQAADVFALQEELAGEIADHLRLRLTRDDRKRLQKRHTGNARAYEAYLRGRFHLAQRTREGFEKAIESFDHAIAADERYALAYAGLADCYTLMGTAAYVDAPAAAAVRARSAAQEAIRLDDELAEAHSALGFVHFRVDWNWGAAETSFARACKLSPGHASAHHRYALLLSALGKHEEALGRIRHAYELDPLSLIIGSAYGRLLHFSRRYDEAIEQLRHTLDQDPSFVQGHFDLGLAYAEAGRFSDAIAEVEGHFARAGRRSVVLGVLGNFYARAGQPERARAMLAEVRRLTGADDTPDCAYVLAPLGELDEACTALERAYDARSGLLVFVKVEPMLDPLRAHPRFAALLRRLRLE